jgi:hypothetical protein
VIAATLPLRIESTPNKREHWAAKARRTSLHRTTAHYALKENLAPRWSRIKVRLIRVAPRAMDSDNLAAGFKAVRDGVADWLGIDDGSDRVVWEYAQTKGAVREYMVRVQVVDWSAA